MQIICKWNNLSRKKMEKMHSNITNPKKKSEKTQFRNFKDLILFLSLFIKKLIKLLFKALLISFILLRESEKHL
jgi:hypothetical protein